MGVEQVKPRGAASPEQLQLLHRRAYRWFYVAGGAVAVSAALPWVSVLGIISAHPSGGQILLILFFAAAYGGAGYLVRERRATRTLLIGIWAVNVVLGLIIIGFYSSLSEGEGIVGPAVGVFVAGIGVIVGIAATVQLHRSRAKPAIVDLPAGAQISPDGNWWWDGREWLPTPEQQRRPTDTARTVSDVPAVRLCPSCNAEMQIGDAFCGRCGAQQGDEPADSERSVSP